MGKIKLSQYFEVPPEVAGYLEWGSGILRVNCSFEEWEEINRNFGNPRSEFARSVLATVTHETFHFLQICTTGFLYAFACRYFDLMRNLIKNRAGYPLTEVKIRFFLNNPPEHTDEIIDHISLLDRPGHSGITVRSIVESAAYFYEHATHYPNIDARAYDEILARDKPPEEYYQAYSLSKEILGNTAFSNFLLAAFISLCFSRPEMVYEDVLKIIASNSLNYKDDRDLSKFFQAVQPLFSSHSALGSAAEVALNGSNAPLHPVYKNVILSLNETADKINPIELVVNPQAMTVEAALGNVRPVVFNKNHVLIPRSFEKQSSQEQLTTEMTVVILLGAMILAIGRSESVPSRFRVIPEGDNEYNG